MSKENNDDIEQEKEDAQVIETKEEEKDNEVKNEEVKKKDNETTDEDVKEKDNDANDDDSQNEGSDSSEATENDEADSENPSGSKKILIAEIVIAVAAIGFIIFALVSNNIGNDSVSDNTVPDAGTATIDNSILYEDIPAIPAIEEFNQITEEEAQAAVTDGTMLQLTTADGASLYIGNYDNRDYFLEQTSVSESDIDDFIAENILSNFSEVTETDHTVVSENDVISANFVGKLDGVAFENGSAENEEIIVGAGGYIPGFEEGFIGMAVGETKDVPITFPENYGNDLGGKDVVFTLTVNEIIGTMTYPEELTDEIVQQFFYDGSCTTVTECRELVKDLLTENNVWGFVTDNYYISAVSEEAVYEYYNEEMAMQEQTAAQYGMSLTDLLSLMGQSMEDLKQSMLIDAGYTAILYSICDAIATKEGIAVSDEDIASLATEYGYSDDVETFLSIMGEKVVREYLLQQKVLDYLVSLVPQ